MTREKHHLAGCLFLLTRAAFILELNEITLNNADEKKRIPTIGFRLFKQSAANEKITFNIVEIVTMLNLAFTFHQ